MEHTNNENEVDLRSAFLAKVNKCCKELNSLTSKDLNADHMGGDGSIELESAIELYKESGGANCLSFLMTAIRPNLEANGLLFTFVFEINKFKILLQDTSTSYGYESVFEFHSYDAEELAGFQLLGICGLLGLPLSIATPHSQATASTINIQDEEKEQLKIAIDRTMCNDLGWSKDQVNAWLKANIPAEEHTAIDLLKHLLGELQKIPTNQNLPLKKNYQ